MFNILSGARAMEKEQAERAAKGLPINAEPPAGRGGRGGRGGGRGGGAPQQE
jgi:hypothetical protein